MGRHAAIRRGVDAATARSTAPEPLPGRAGAPWPCKTSAPGLRRSQVRWANPVAAHRPGRRKPAGLEWGAAAGWMLAAMIPAFEPRSGQSLLTGSSNDYECHRHHVGGDGRSTARDSALWGARDLRGKGYKYRYGRTVISSAYAMSNASALIWNNLVRKRGISADLRFYVLSLLANCKRHKDMPSGVGSGLRIDQTYVRSPI